MAANLQQAVALLEVHGAQQPIQRDFVAHAEIVSAWISMTCGHSLLEQSIKALLRKRGLPEAEQRGATGHDLGGLYDVLPDEDKSNVEREFSALAGRYGALPWSGAAHYLNSVGSDYTPWRYLLIELPRSDLSTTHPDALLAIARAVDGD